MNTDERPNEPGAARTLALVRDFRILIGQLKRWLREEARPGGLTPAQIAVISRLERGGPLTVTGLARAEGLRPQSMGATVAALQMAGLVAGSADPADGRQTLLSLTDACRKLIAGNRAAREDWLFQAVRARFTPAEQQELANAVALLKRLIDDPHP
ncbi:MarR family transcriptional regulator [Enterobacteriales bacterium SAP-6]|uniref:MarR family transcriptional regulator n=2 Tax=Acerihabitans arboris TaxID=2691583 RepID=A0A845SLT3_9GAMM|nr:MarR family transcriptional regulator [Acerihabitans arboris]